MIFLKRLALVALVALLCLGIAGFVDGFKTNHHLNICTAMGARQVRTTDGKMICVNVIEMAPASMVECPGVDNAVIWDKFGFYCKNEKLK